MSQDVSTNPRVKEPLTHPIQPWSAEAEADRLMDELFSDIDRILEGGSRLPTEPVKPEYISLEPIVVPQLAMPPAVIPPKEKELVQQPTPDLTSPEPVKPIEPSVVEKPSPPAKRSGWSFQQFMLAAGIASLILLIGTILWLLISQQKLTWPWSVKSGSPPTPKSQLSESDAQFISYMLRSLEVIDNKTKAKQQKASAAGSTATTHPPPVPGNRAVTSNQAPTVLERVYIPVPQAQTPLAPLMPSSAARPSLPAPPSAARSSAPAPSPAARPPIPTLPSAARSSAPAPSAVARAPIPTLPWAARSSAPVSLAVARPPIPTLPWVTRPPAA